MSLSTDQDHLSAHDEAIRSDTRFFGQPVALAPLFNVELWERFSYYGMQGILAIYLYFSVAESGLGLPESVAVGVVGAYGGSVFLATILGAWVADRLLGSERVLFFSAVTIMAGHLALALIPALAGVAIGCVLVALGSGGLKATSATIVGSLYGTRDPRRDAGFSLFYMSVNIGALFGPMLTGLAQKWFGFHVGFGLAAVGMALGLTIYALGRKSLPDSSRLVPNPLPSGRRWVIAAIPVAAALLVWVLFATGLMTLDNLSWWVAAFAAAAMAIYFVVILTSPKVDAVERSRTVSFIPLLLCNVVFWSLYQQIFGVLTTYSDGQMDRTLFGWEMPISWIQLIPAAFVILFAPVFTVLWTKLGDRQPTTPVKFGLALPLIGAGYLLFLPYSDAGPGATPLLWVAFAFVLFVAGEMLISPVGLSLSTKLAPRVFSSQMVALYYLSSALGTTFAGVFGQYYDAANQAPYWLTLGLAAIAVGALQLAFAKPVHALMRGVN